MNYQALNAESIYNLEINLLKNDLKHVSLFRIIRRNIIRKKIRDLENEILKINKHKQVRKFYPDLV